MTRTREQKGYVWREGDWWFIRYRDSRLVDGAVQRRQMSAKLSPVLPEHRRLTRPPAIVEEEQLRFMDRINGSQASPEHNVTLAHLVDNVWFPHIEMRLAKSTVHHYRYYWQHILRPRCGSVLVRDFRTPTAQALLDSIARANPSMKKATLRRLKSLMSSIFSFAIRQEYRPKAESNPFHSTELPEAPESEETGFYDLDTIFSLLRIVPEPGRTVIAVAAFAGLRKSEIQGLTWEAFTGDSIMVMRGLWRGIAGRTKSKKSRAPVPVIAPLRKLLEQHRLRSGNPQTGPMFLNERNATMCLDTLAHCHIRPALEACAECGESEAKHATAKHEYRRNPSLPRWSGWHSFRRGLGTNLHTMGIDDLVIQRILRHSDVSITQAYYIKTLPAQVTDAMKKLELEVDPRFDSLATALVQ